MMMDYPEGDMGKAKDEPGEKPADTETEGDEGETALLPKSLFGGECKVGDEYTVKVVGVLEDEIEVAPVKKEKANSETSSKSRMAMAGDKLDMMENG